MVSVYRNVEGGLDQVVVLQGERNVDQMCSLRFDCEVLQASANSLFGPENASKVYFEGFRRFRHRQCDGMHGALGHLVNQPILGLREGDLVGESEKRFGTHLELSLIHI